MTSYLQGTAVLVGTSNIDAFKAWQEVRTSRFRDRDIDRLRARGYLPPDLADVAMAEIAARDSVIGYGSHTIPINIDLEQLAGHIGPWWRHGVDDLCCREEIVSGDDVVTGADDFGPWWSRGFDPFYEIDLNDVEPQEDEFFVRTPSGGVRKVILGCERDAR